MSKVLIDRELLERVQERLDPHRDAVLWGAVCDTFHTAPSGTPVMPVKAYYHEAPNEYGGLNKSVGLEVRKEFTDAPLVLESDAMECIACLEGEIAKRDARIVELESQYQRDVYGLNNEGDPIGGDPAGGYANDNARLRSELAAIKAQEPVCYTTQGMLEIARENWNGVQRIGAHVKKDHRFDIPLYAAPVSEAKAQGVVMPEPMKRGDEGGSGEYGAAMIRGYNACLREVARLNATPVQQGSMPDVSAMARMLADRNADACNVNREDNWAIYGQDYIEDVTAMLAAAQAAPAADALVEALELAANRLDRLALEQGEFWRGYATAWADEARTAHRAQGVK